MAVANAATYRTAADHAAAPRDAALDLATGIVLAEQRCGPEEALDWLRERATSRGVGVADLARVVVAARTARDA